MCFFRDLGTFLTGGPLPNDMAWLQTVVVPFLESDMHGALTFAVRLDFASC